jgi:hypothetical protein
MTTFDINTYTFLNTSILTKNGYPYSMSAYDERLKGPHNLRTALLTQTIRSFSSLW